MNNKDISCICGHKENQHYIRAYVTVPNYKSICWGCSVFKGIDVFYHEFKPDNLMYLEELAEKEST